MNDYITMKEIGRLFGISSHVVGRALKELGHRTHDGRPSGQAFAERMVDQKWTADQANYLWAWHAEKTCTILERAGYSRVQAVNNSAPASY